MNKKVMAVAVASLFTAPLALAQTSNVQIYGRANLGFDQYEAEGATNSALNRKDRFRVFDNSSRVGLRGTEDLGGGLKAIFQIETGVNIDSGSSIGQNGVNNASTGFWASRTSFVGLDSNFGRLTLGRQDIYWANGVNAQFAANYINTEIPWTNGTQLGRISLQAASVARVSNTVQYTSPTFAGMNITASYSPNAQEAEQTAASTPDADGRIWGLTWRGTWGPIYGQLDYANVTGNTPAVGTKPEGEAYKAGVSWGYMPGARIGAIWVRTDVNNGTGQVQGVTTGDGVKQDGWTINWEHTFGNVQLMAQYGQLLKMKDCDGTSPPGACDNTEADAWMIGARYLLSKRTWLYASYNQVDNDSGQFADYTGGGQTSTAFTAATMPLGADPQIIAIGIFHQF